MAKNKERIATPSSATARNDGETAAVVTRGEATYTARELANACRKLGPGVTPDCVTAAMATAKKECATLSEAGALVAKYMKKGVQ